MNEDQLSKDGPSWMLPVVSRDPASEAFDSAGAQVAGALSINPAVLADGRAMPTMEVASSFSSKPVPFGLDGPLDLRGGDRLGPTGIAFDLMMDWQPNLVRAISYACNEQRLRGRNWFFMPPAVLRGPTGVGRSHVARRIAAASDVPFLEIDANDGAGRGHHARPNVRLPSPLIVGMALTRCANPIVLIRNLETASVERVARVSAMIDPRRNRRFVDEALGASLDLGAVTWFIDGATTDMLPECLRDVVGWVDLEELAEEAVALLVVDIIAEVIADFDLPRPSTRQVLQLVQHFERRVDGRSACEIYRHVSRELGADDDDPPF